MEPSAAVSGTNAPTASADGGGFFFQDQATGFLYRHPSDTPHGHQYRDLTSNDERLAFMKQHGRLTGRVPPPEEQRRHEQSGPSPEALAAIHERREKGMLASRDADGNWIITPEEARRRLLDYRKTLQPQEQTEEGSQG